jgi:hypothetical protein
MREMTIYDLDGELAEQLPARELMNCCRLRSSSGNVYQTNLASQTNGNQVNSAHGALAGNVLNINAANNSNLGSFFGNTGIQQGNLAG